MTQIKPIAFIHARGGSKRIPRKNIKDFLGKPVIAYAIEAALNSGVFSKVIISTDDTEIADIAVQYGAECLYMRSSELANDTATTDAVFINDIKTIRAQGFEFNHACCIYGTSVFLKSEYLKQAYDMFDKDTQTVMSITEYDFSIFRAFLERDDGTIALREPQHRHTRSQDLSTAYHDAAQFYFVNVEKYLKSCQLFADANVRGVKIPNSSLVDIDTPDDWIRAEKYYKLLHDDK